MCKSIISWVPDPEVSDSHNSRPVTCDEYIQALETYLKTGPVLDYEFLIALRAKLNLD